MPNEDDPNPGRRSDAQYRARIEKVLNDDVLSDRHAETLSQYRTFLANQDHKPGSIYNALNLLRDLADHLASTPFGDADKASLDAFVDKMRDRYAKSTLQSHGANLRSFYRWLVHGTHDADDPDMVDDYRFQRPDRLPRNIPDLEDVVATARAGEHVRDRAIVMTLASTGLRASELAGLKIRDVDRDAYGFRLHVRGKGDKERKVRVTDGTPDLKDWWNEHPWTDDPDAPLFPSLRHKTQPRHLSGKSVYKVVKKLSRWALGEAEAFGPHKLRHFDATRMARHLTEPVLRERYGWAPGSDTPKIYTHLSGRDTDDEVLTTMGYEAESSGNEPPRPPACPSCETLVSHTRDYCPSCRHPVSEAGAAEMVASDRKGVDQAEMEQVLDGLLERNPDLVKAFLQEALEQWNNQQGHGSPPLPR